MQIERRENIKKLLEAEGMVNAQDLAQRFHVSTETIRRDLEVMEADGLALRVHGGAVTVRRHLNESAYQARMQEHTPQKQAIAKVAAGLVQEGDTVLISPGTTTLEVASFLKDKKSLTVITNSLPIAMELSSNPGITVCCLGGKVRGEDYAAAGITTLENLKLYNADKLILGVGCISPEEGVSDYRMEEAMILKSFVGGVKTIIGVADSSKFGMVSGFNVCPAAELDYLVTDDGVSAAYRKAFKKMNVKLLVADAE